VTRAVLLLAVVVAAGCSLGREEAEASRVDRCVDRLLSRATPETLTPERRAVAERYARETYCERFEREGWVNEDGTLSIDAHRWLVDGMRCAVGGDGEPDREVDCEELAERERDPMLDCALLHHVRDEEVQAYVREVERRRGVEPECDDGTPVDELGVG